MARLTVLSRDPEATRALGRGIGERLVGGEVIRLSGPLGAGKTTLVQGLATGLGIQSRVQSPSFVLERIHQGRLLLRHLDFYRLDAAQVDELGFFDELDDSAVTVIEWAERAEDVPGTKLRIDISLVAGDPESRTITIEALDQEWGEKMRDVARESGLG